MNCTICGKRIVLIPSATERAKKFGGKPSDYSRLFTTHDDCAIAKRERETVELMRRQTRVFVDRGVNGNKEALPLANSGQFAEYAGCYSAWPNGRYVGNFSIVGE